jgi:hypothetical protein
MKADGKDIVKITMTLRGAKIDVKARESTLGLL